MSETKDKIRDMLKEHLGLTDADLVGGDETRIFYQQDDGPTARAATLGGDSLDWVELVMAVEEAFEIEVPDDAAEDPKLHTIDGLAAYIDENRPKM